MTLYSQFNLISHIKLNDHLNYLPAKCAGKWDFLTLNVCTKGAGWLGHPLSVQTFKLCSSRPNVCQCLGVQTPVDNMSENKSSTPMTHVACKAKLLSVVKLSMHPWPGNWVSIGCAVVYYAQAVHVSSAEIKCCHCTSKQYIPRLWI